MFELKIIFFCVLGLIFIFKIIIEPFYFYFFNEPIGIHWYLNKQKLSPNQKKIINNHFTFYKRLSPRKKDFFDHRVKTFIKRNEFIAKGIEITEEMKILIASTSVMLTFGMRSYNFTVLRKILIYPSAFYSQINDEMHLGEFNPKFKVLAISWEDFYKGIKIEDNNLNLGIHEFAHVLLFEAMKQRKKHLMINDISYNHFSDIFLNINSKLKQSEYIQSIKKSHYFRDYAFVNSIEFIAVILEHFFETPDVFKNEFPELYTQVKEMINYRES